MGRFKIPKNEYSKIVFKSLFNGITWGMSILVLYIIYTIIIFSYVIDNEEDYMMNYEYKYVEYKYIQPIEDSDTLYNLVLLDYDDRSKTDIDRVPKDEYVCTSIGGTYDDVQPSLIYSFLLALFVVYSLLIIFWGVGKL